MPQVSPKSFDKDLIKNKDSGVRSPSQAGVTKSWHVQ